MAKLIEVNEADDILPQYRNSAIEQLLHYHNLEAELSADIGLPNLIIGKCMDYRENLRRPGKFAYTIRAAGANMHGHEFEISYAIAVGNCDTLALLVHTDCGMSHVTEKHDRFVQGLVERAGASSDEAEQQFLHYAALYEIGEPTEFALAEADRLRQLYPKILIAPLLFRVEDSRLVQIVSE